MIVRILIAFLLLASSAYAAVDLSEYRTATYGAPDHYCDPTRSLDSSGTGTLGDPWNMTQCGTEPVAGEVIGVLPVSSGTAVTMADSGAYNIPSLNPTNEGTFSGGTCTAKIVYVAKYAAISLDYDTITSNQNRTELRGYGTDDNADYVGTGQPVYGSYERDCIVYDGFFVDMAHMGFHNDSGVIRAQNASGVEFRNFVIKGATFDCDSNCVLWRPHNITNTVLSNFRVKDFDNDPTSNAGRDTDNINQQGFFSDGYGEQNSLYEHFEIANTDNGIFLKGTTPGPVYNYATIQYGIVSGTRSCYQFNDLDGTHTTTLQYVVCHSTSSDQGDGIVFDSITTAARNITIDHITIAKLDASSINTNAGLYVQDLGLGSNVVITNSVFDNNNGSYGHQIALLSQLPATLNYNCYTKNGATETYVYNSTEYNSFASWQAAISGRDANSQEVASIGFADRANNDFDITSGACLTASSTGGEVGAYATSEVIGPDTNAAASSGSVTIGGSVRFTGSVRIQ